MRGYSKIISLSGMANGGSAKNPLLSKKLANPPPLSGKAGLPPSGARSAPANFKGFFREVSGKFQEFFGIFREFSEFLGNFHLI